MSKFFIRGNKRTLNKKEKSSKKLRLGPSKPTRASKHDEEIDSDSDLEVAINDEEKYSSESEGETAQEKRLRLAHEHLRKTVSAEKDRLDVEEIGKDVISHRLREEVLEQAGKLKKFIADQYIGHGEVITLKCKEHSRPITCLILSAEDEYMYTASEDCNIVKWSLKTRSKVRVCRRQSAKGHKKKILSLALSTDNKFLASGDIASIINIWDPNTLEHVHTFRGHKKSVNGLAFRKNTHQLFSCSADNSVKIWSLDEMSYVETLFGHSSMVTSVDSLLKDRAVTAGGRDGTIRIWKVPEETHLILNGLSESIDCVKLINEENFVSGGDGGFVCLWSSIKKKPVHTLAAAHGINTSTQTPNWIISVATYLQTDLFATGSWNGLVNIYKCQEHFKSFSLLFTVPLEGNINTMSFTSDGLFLLVGVGREHKLGRWNSINNVRNSVVIVPLVKKT